MAEQSLIKRIMQGPRAMLHQACHVNGIERYGSNWAAHESTRWASLISAGEHDNIEELTFQQLYVLWCMLAEGYPYGEAREVVERMPWNS